MNRGTTLIEFILYFTIAGFLVTAAGLYGIDVLFSKARAVAMEEVQYNARFSLRMVHESIRDAVSINTPTPTTFDSILSINTSDPATTPTIYSVSGNTLLVTEGITAPVAITSPDVVVTDFTVHNVSGSVAGALHIELTLEYTNPDQRPEYTVSRSYYIGSSLRYNQ
jgi:hypothetical protein